MGSGVELEIWKGVLFNRHNANSTLIKKLLKLMNWEKKIDEESECVHRDQRRAAQPTKRKFGLDRPL